MNRNYNIGVFDSGLGGVTVLKELRKLLPNENIIYFGDTKNVPYGEKTKEEIQALSHKIVGLGGVTVLKELRKLLPNENIIYFGDTKNVPYGEKTKEEIQALSHKIVDFLTKNNCKVIIIACNTASIAAYEYLRSVSSVPIIGIINSGLESIKKL